MSFSRAVISPLPSTTEQKNGLTTYLQGARPVCRASDQCAATWGIISQWVMSAADSLRQPDILEALPELGLEACVPRGPVQCRASGQRAGGGRGTDYLLISQSEMLKNWNDCLGAFFPYKVSLTKTSLLKNVQWLNCP